MTFKSGFIRTQIDYFLVMADNRRFCKDCKVISSEYLGTPHRLLVLDVELKCSKWKKLKEVLGNLELSGGVLLRRIL